jgi:amino acid adenylation domain-containing protein/FkbM family methyltransferase
VLDGWSLPVLLKEVTAYYEGYCRGEEVELGRSRSYGEYIRWVRSQDLGAAERYWREQLRGFSAATRLGIETGSDAEEYREQQLSVAAETSSRLQQLSREQQVTLNTIVQGAWGVLLSRYSGESDVVFGATVSGRPAELAGVETMIGVFINTLPVRVRVAGEQAVGDWLRQLQAEQFEARQYEYSPLVAVQSWSEVGPGESLFETLLVFENYPVDVSMQQLGGTPSEREGNSGLTITKAVAVERANYPLAVTVAPGPMIHTRFSYEGQHFDDDTIARMLGHWEVLLEGIAADPNRLLTSLPLLSEAERHQLLVQWNQTQKEYSTERCLHHLFEAQAELMADARALVFEDQELSCAELNARANQLAHYLQKLGVGPEVRVGLLLDRSAEMVIALLGVMKAGGAYVPLDSTYPRDRLALILEDAQISVLLTQADLANLLPPHDAKVIRLDADADLLAQESERNTESAVSADNLIYVIYTSGSTGQPKGVAVEHRQVLNYIEGILPLLQISPGDNLATVSTIAADLGNTMIFPALVSGAALHVIAQEKVSDPDALADYFEQHRIDYLKIVPSHLAALQSSAHPERVLPGRLLILGGEASRVDWVNSLRTLATECAILNHYGPTETTIGVLTYNVDSGEPHTATLPLGRPLANTQVYVLDTDLRAVPMGATGELFIGGDGLARGYFKQPELTAEKFIPNPFGGKTTRLYRTGDMVRYLSDGNLEFLGRRDHQVKVRGFRIELGEIERALKEHPDVRDAALIARSVNGSIPGDQQLIAYVAPHHKRAPTIAGHSRYKLPNQLSVAQLNKNETDYMYREIFELQAYLKHGITLRDGDCVFDVGANIGLFMLFVKHVCPGAKVYSFEPNPFVGDILKANALLSENGCKQFNCGLSSKPGTATFTFFPGFSLLSGLYADPETEKQVVKTFILNQQRLGLAEVGELLTEADDILQERFASLTFPVTLNTLSRVIEEEKIERIDLLKINVEKSELDVLKGIRDEDWKKIKQIVLEVDVSENVEGIVSLLKRHGYELAIEQDYLLEDTPLCYLYAIRPSAERRLLEHQEKGAHVRRLTRQPDPLLSPDELKNFLSGKLPPQMIPTEFVLLEALPLTPNGKLDRRALSALGDNYSTANGQQQGPRTPIEEALAGIWAQVLHLDHIGVNATFFDLGGHSLLATQVISRIRQVFKIELPLRVLFESPTVRALAIYVEQALRAARGLRLPPLTRASRSEDLPLSFAQQRLWLLDQLEPGSTVYNIPTTLRLSGKFSLAALAESLTEVARRHEVLRTTFNTVQGRAVQRIVPTMPMKLPLIDLSRLARDVRETEARRIGSEEVRTPFDLAHGPLLRTTVLRLGATEHVILLTMHHIITDEWSMNLLVQEVATLYQAYNRGESSPLPELSVQYADYAVWQREWLQGEVLEEQLTYWREQLGGELPVLELPADFPRPAVQSYRGAHVEFDFSGEVAAQLRLLSRTESTTMFMALLGAFAVLLARLSGQAEVVIGSPIAGRTHLELEPLLGFFINQLVLRIDLKGEPSFQEVLGRVRETTLGAYAHQDVPFEKLVEELEPARDLSRSPLFQVMFVLQNEANVQESISSELTAIGLPNTAAQFDLTLAMRESANHLGGILQYNRDLFEQQTVERMVEHFRMLLESIAADASQTVAHLPLLTAAERVQLLVQSTGPRVNNAPPYCLHELFEEQVSRRPEAVAISFGARLSYRELNERANQLAHYLRGLGVGPEVRVGLLLERSVDLVVSVLAIHKAGGAYVPLDVEHPLHRQIFVLEDAQIPVLLTKQRLSAGVSEQFKGKVVCLDTEREQIEQQSGENPEQRVSGENLAYIIYTSGSTGVPKGVMLMHRGACNMVHVEQQLLRLDGESRMLQFASLSFDGSVWEIFGTLGTGGVLVLAEREELAGEALGELLAAQQVTTVTLPPSVLSTVLYRELPELKTLVVSGEASRAEVVEKWATGRRVFNGYGPTEATVCASMWEWEIGARPLIGRAIENAELYVLDEEQELAPVGVKGELCIGGAGLARGYLERPELTAEKFIAHPFSRVGGERLYRSGDLVRRQPNGHLEFIGRIDEQVKVRACRVELGEIEMVLREHASVKDAVVMVQDGEVIGYLVAEEGAELASSELRAHLREKLPDYMVPSSFTLLTEIPLTTSGKVNRRALLNANGAKLRTPLEFVAPRTPIEEMLAEIWSQILGVKQIGVNHNFFELGGNSLLATQVAARLRLSLEMPFPLRTLFEATTLADLAVKIEELIIEDINKLSDEEAQRFLSTK